MNNSQKKIRFFYICAHNVCWNNDSIKVGALDRRKSCNNNTINTVLRMCAYNHMNEMAKQESG